MALGDVILGESGSAGFTISNGAGHQSLEVTDITSSDGEFTVSPTRAVIAGGASQLFTVDFKPGGLGDQTAALTITSNDGVHTVTVTGTGVAAPPPPQPPPPPTQPGAAIRVDCNVYNFGTVRVGSSTDLPLVLANTGDQTLVVSDIRVSNAEFSVVPASGSVAPDGSLEAGVVFHPVSAGSKTVRLTVSSNAINGPEVLVDFIGVVESGPNLSIGQPGPYIGSIPLGRSIYTGFTLTNVGDEELQVYSIICGGEIFTVNDTAFTLQPGQGVPVDLSFLPAEGGYHDAEVVVSSSDPDRGTVTLDFRGHGKTAPDIQLYMGGDILSVGRVEVGVPGVDYIFVVNNGREDLAVSSLACDNPAFLFMPQQFSVMADSASRISVYFSPSEVGLQSAEATLSCNDPDRESLSFAVTGEGVVIPRLRVPADTLDLGEVRAGLESSATFYVVNDGSAELEVSGIEAVVGGCFCASPASCGIAPGDSQQITVVFTPPGRGDYSTSLAISTNGGSDELWLVGVGESVFQSTTGTLVLTVSTGTYIPQTTLAPGNEGAAVMLIVSRDGGVTFTDTITCGCDESGVFSASLPAEGSDEGEWQYYFEVEDETGYVYRKPLGGRAYSLILAPGADVNGDGSVNVFDLLELLQKLADPVQGDTGGDVDGDGMTNVFDLLYLLNILGSM